MPLTATVSRDCKFIDIQVNYSLAGATYPLAGELKFTDVQGNSLITNMSVVIQSQFSPSSVVIPVDTLSTTTGVVNIEFCYLSDVIYTYPVLIHCDIDCCLSKLTNELIDCACDCAKCSSALAKAQKIFLLIKSAEYALAQAQAAASGNIPGYILDAHNKYIKARQICDDSCGCNC